VIDRESKRNGVRTEDVKDFWEANPLCSHIIPHALGSEDFFRAYDAEREAIESPARSAEIHEYRSFAGKRVLDVGSGNGYVLSRYALVGAEVFGVDLTDQAIALCRQRFSYMGLVGDFRVADAEKLPFPDNSFDCVCSMGVLHHVPDTERAIREIVRVLRPGGRLIVMFYHRNSAKYRWAFPLLSLLTGKSLSQLVNEFDGVGNPKGSVYSRSQLRLLLRDFTDLRMDVGYVVNSDIVPRGARYLPKGLFSWLGPLLGWNLYAKALKPK
jgi:SAM-dependent methyltransferase